MAKNNAIDIDIETGGGNTYTFPSATSTLATLDLAETLTNKDLSDASNTLGSANVEAAGALMESEVTNLTEVKAFDSTDYAAALGTDDNYVTDAEKTVIGNTSGTNTGDQDLSGLAVKTNVLELNNTTAFTPDADYEPATKKYVDDNGGGGDLWSDLVDADIIPDGDKTRDLGSDSAQFNNVFTDDISIKNDITLKDGLGTSVFNKNGDKILNIITGPQDDYTNYVVIAPAITGSTPYVRAFGSDTNVDLNLRSKGTGKVQANGEEVATVRGAVNTQTGTTYTLVIGDEYLDGVRMTNASANTLTIPPNSAVAFPVGTKVFITQGGAGSTTIAAGAGVTINAPSTVTLAIGEQYESRVCQKTATDTWLLI